MLDEISKRLESNISDFKTIGRKCVAEMLLEDNQENLTQCAFRIFLNHL